MPDINEVKSVIRGLLTSCAEEVTVAKLRHDYRAQEGKDIPFYEFKFHDVTSFLRSIPDVCQVCSNPFGPYAIVRLVKSQKSAHISSLVRRQRSTTKTRRKPLNTFAHGRISYKIPHSLVKKPFKQTVHKTISTDNSSSYSSKLAYSVESSSLNASAPEFNLRVKEPLHSNDTSDASWKLKDEHPDGFENTLQASTFAHNEESEDFSIVGIHIHQVLTNHEGISLYELEEKLNESLNFCKLNISVTQDSIKDLIETMPDFVLKGDKVFYTNSQDLKMSCNGLVDASERVASGGTENTTCEMNTKVIDESPLEDHYQGSSYPFIPTEGNDKVQRLERNLYSLMKDCPHGILLTDLIEKYKLKFAAPLNFQIVGCKSVEELVSIMSSIFSSVELENKEIKLFPAWLPDAFKDNSVKSDIPNSKKIDIPLLIKKNVQWLMQSCPDGLHCKEFKQSYRDTFYGEIDLNELGFSSLLEFLNSLEKEGIIQICVYDSGTWLLPPKSPVDISANWGPLPKVWSGESQEELNIVKQSFPNDVVGPENLIEAVVIPLTVKRGSMIEIYIQELHNPHNFWVTFVGDSYTTALEILMNDIQAFYCSRSHSYRMAPELVRKGQECVALYSGEWNRARVIRIINAKEVEVLFFDYGTKSIVLGNTLYFLHNSFSSLPAQAIRAVLANLAPVGAAWTKEASKRFLSLIADRPLIGIVQNVDRQSRVLSLFLCDTNGEDDIYISNVLISEGYAVETEGMPETESNDNILKSEVLDGAGDDFTETMEAQFSEPLQNEDLGSNLSIVKDVVHTSTAENLDFRESPSPEREYLVESPSPSLSPSPSPSPPPSPSPSPACLPGISVPSQFLDGSYSPADIVVPLESYESKKMKITDPPSSASKIAPPPGFSPLKNKELNMKIDSSDTCESPFASNKDQVNKSDIKNETFESLPKHKVGVPFPRNYPKSVNSGVNVNFAEEFNAYPMNAQSFAGWPPPVYPNVAGFHPPFVPMDMNSRHALNPLGFPVFPTPMDFYNLWYYEQMRQQAFIRAQTHLNASLLAPLPGGVLLPSNQNVRPPSIYTNNETHISEVHSSPNQVETTSKSIPCGNTAATQTEEVFEGASDQLLVDISSASEVISASKAESPAMVQKGPLSLHERIDNQYSDTTKTIKTVEEGTNTLSISETRDENASRRQIDTLAEAKNVASDCEASNHSSVLMKSDLKHNLKLHSPSLINSSLVDTSSNNGDKFNSFSNKGGMLENTMFSQKTARNDSCMTNKKGVHCLMGNLWEKNQENISLMDFRENCSPLNSNQKTPGNGAENVSGARFSNVICNTKDKIQDCDMNIEDRKIDIFCNSFTNVANVKERNFSKESILNDKNDILSIVDEKVTNGADVKYTDIVLNSFSKALSDTKHDRDNPQQRTSENLLSIKLNPYLINEKQASVLKTQFKNVSNMTCFDDKKFQCFEFGTFQGSASACQSGLIFAPNEIHSDEVISNDKYNFEKKKEDQSSFPLAAVPSSGKNEVSDGKLLKTINSNKQSLFSTDYENSLPSELLDNLVNVCIGDEEKSSVSLNDPDVSCDKKIVCTQLNESSVILQDSRESCFAEANGKTKSHTSSLDCEKSSIKREVTHSDLEARSRKSQVQVPDSLLRRATSDVPIDNLAHQSSVSMPQGSSNKDVHLSQKNNPEVESAPKSWTTTWSSESKPQLVVTKFNTKRTVSEFTGHSSKTSGSFQSYDYFSLLRDVAKPRYVKRINLLEHNIHLINLDGRPHVPTDEIIRNFTSFNGHHVVLKILDARKIEINFLELCRRRRPDIFDSLDKTDMKFVSRGPTGNIIGSLHTVPLRSIPYMLKALNKDNSAITNAVQDLLLNFDPNDSFWQGRLN